ncbi:MAG: cyclic nucleotide-binding domain-containing protein [Pirellulaceae bacterium]
MNQSIDLETLRQTSFFSGIPDEQLARLAEISREASFQRGDMLFQEGDLGDEVYIVVKGEVSVVICTPKVGCRHIGTVSDGELVAWSPMLQHTRLSAGAHVIAATRVIAINAAKLRALCEEDAKLGYHFLHRIAEVLAERLSGTRMRLMEAHGVHLPEFVPETD